MADATDPQHGAEPASEPVPENRVQQRVVLQAVEASGTMNPLFLKLLTSEVMVIALATLAAYALVFSYEVGFCWYYGIPYNLISLNLTTGLGVAVALLSAFYTLVFLEYPFGKLWLLRKDEDFRTWADRITWWTIYGGALTFGGLNCVAIIALIVFTDLTAPRMRRILMKSKRVTGFLAQQSGPMFYQVVGRRLPPRLHFLLSLVVFFLIVSFVYGRYRASVEPELISTANGRHYIMLQFYGDYVVAAPYVILKNQNLRYLEGYVRQDVLAVQPGLRIFKLGETDSPQDFLVKPTSMPLRTPRQAAHQGFTGWLRSYAYY
jgi:hypothetical protein